MKQLCFVLAGLALFSLCRTNSVVSKSGRYNAAQHYSAGQRNVQHNKANFMMEAGATTKLPIASSIVNPYGNAPQHLPGSGQVALNKQTTPADLVESATRNVEGGAGWRPPVLFETKRRKRAK